MNHVILYSVYKHLHSSSFIYVFLVTFVCVQQGWLLGRCPAEAKSGIWSDSGPVRDLKWLQQRILNQIKESHGHETVDWAWGYTSTWNDCLQKPIPCTCRLLYFRVHRSKFDSILVDTELKIFLLKHYDLQYNLINVKVKEANMLHSKFALDVNAKYWRKFWRLLQSTVILSKI